MKEILILLVMTTVTTGGLVGTALGIVGAAFGVTKTFGKN